MLEHISYRLSKRCRRFRNVLLDPYYWYTSRRELTNGIRNISSPEDAVDLAWNFRGGGFYAGRKPNQDRYELTALAERVQSISPRVIVELGTRYGGTLLVWSQCSPRLEKLISIDLPGGIHGGGYTPQRGRLYKLFAANRPTCEIKLLRRDSQKQSTKAKLLKLLRGHPVDFLFIDADHRYEGVKRDYELYSHLVRPGGLIAFHDIRPNPELPTIEVYRLWNEVKSSEPYAEEIICEPYRGKFGIGLITKA